MILCGSITDSELRARLLALAEDMGWDSWITHESGLLGPMLEAEGKTEVAARLYERGLPVFLDALGTEAPLP